MALRFLDGMLHYSIPSQLANKYTSFNNSSISSMTGRRSSTTAILLQSQGDYLAMTFDNQPTWVVGFAYQTMGSESGVLLQANDSAANDHRIQWRPI